MNGVSGDALTEPSSALIVGSVTPQERHHAQLVAVTNARSIDEARDFLEMLGLNYRVEPDSEK